MKEIITLILEDILLPPCGSLILLSIAYFIRNRFKRISKICFASGILSIYLISTPFFSIVISTPLMKAPSIENNIHLSSAEAIVVLGAGTRSSAPEYFGNDTIDGHALDRLRYGAFLNRKSGLPLLLTGGFTGSTTSEAEAMNHTLEDEFNLKARWLEKKSINTKENAAFTKEILFNENITQIILVTNSYHMRRAILEFEAVGFEVIPGPTHPRIGGALNLLSFIPSGRSLHLFKSYAHEWLGIAWHYVNK